MSRHVAGASELVSCLEANLLAVIGMTSCFNSLGWGEPESTRYVDWLILAAPDEKYRAFGGIISGKGNRSTGEKLSQGLYVHQKPNMHRLAIQSEPPQNPQNIIVIHQ
jgi:hypothetical protein